MPFDDFHVSPYASTPFAVYIGFKDPEREGTMLEAKFYPSQLAEDGWTWDIGKTTRILHDSLFL